VALFLTCNFWSAVSINLLTILFLLFWVQVLFEARSLVHGKWPAFTCRNGVGEGALSRLAYTWISITYGSILFYVFGISVYQVLGRIRPSGFSPFLMVVNHAFGTRSISWLLLAFVPIICMIFDVTLKVFSNMFYPTQTQIHIEIESKEKRILKQREKKLLNEMGRLDKTSINAEAP
jgi:CBS domain containing-hemolysin-like protein